MFPETSQILGRRRKLSGDVAYLLELSRILGRRRKLQGDVATSVELSQLLQRWAGTYPPICMKLIRLP
jgi:hypothetical protein